MSILIGFFIMYEIFIKYLFKPQFIISCNIVMLISYITGYETLLDIPTIFLGHFILALYKTIIEVNSNKKKKKKEEENHK